MIQYRLGAVLLSFILAAGVAAAKEQVPMAPQSGFLGDYSQLQPVPDREGVKSWIDKSADYKLYTKVIFDSIEVLAANNPEYEGTNPQIQQKLKDDLTIAFNLALQPTYQVVDRPGPDVLHLRLAITGVQMVKTPTTATDYIPIKAIFNAGRIAAGESPRLVQMTAEMEVLDPNGKRVAALTAARTGDTTLSQSEQITWLEMEAVAQYWAKSFRQRLDQLRGVDVAP